VTELDIRETSTVEMQPVEPTALMLWAMDAAEAYKVACSLVKTSFVPLSLKGKPEEAAAAILTGQEVGLSPMAALRSIDVIQGTPAMRAHTLRGLVQSQGHEVWVEDASPSRAVVCGRRKGQQQVQRSEWDLERAKGLGLLAKDAWKKQPQAMLTARATAELCRLVASDVLLGLPYAAEELEDGSSDVPSAPAVTRKVSRRTLTQPAEEEPLVESEETIPQPPIDSEDGEWPEVAKPGDADE
jgi:hypothetical protein